MAIRKTVSSALLKVCIFGNPIFDTLTQNIVNPCATLNYAKMYFKTLGRKKKKI